MTTQLITLIDAAERLDVHYMTAYRYVRTGRLAASKEGGQWWVAPDDLAAFESGDPIQTVPRSEVIPPKVAERLVAGDENGTLQILESAMASGANPEEVYLDLLGPAMTTIGQRWHDGELTISDEHLATTTATRVIGRLGHRSSQRGRHRGRIVLAVVAGDQHGLPTAFVRDLLRFRGFEVSDLGANTPAESIVQTASGFNDLLAVGLTATTPDNDKAMSNSIKLLNRGLGVPIVVGGTAFRDVDHIASLGDCIPTSNARDALDKFEEIYEASKANEKKIQSA